MKKIATCTLALCALIAVLTSVTLTSRRFAKVSEVYLRYKDRSDLQVSFVKNYHIGDSITVDVTTITAKDSAGWEALLREFKVDEKLIEIDRKARKNSHKAISTGYRVKNHPEKWPNMKTDKELDLMFFSNKEYTVFIFDTKTHEQAHRISNAKIIEFIPPKNNNNESSN